MLWGEGLGGSSLAAALGTSSLSLTLNRHEGGSFIAAAEWTLLTVFEGRPDGSNQRSGKHS